MWWKGAICPSNEGDGACFELQLSQPLLAYTVQDSYRTWLTMITNAVIWSRRPKEHRKAILHDLASLVALVQSGAWKSRAEALEGFLSNSRFGKPKKAEMEDTPYAILTALSDMGKPSLLLHLKSPQPMVPPSKPRTLVEQAIASLPGDDTAHQMMKCAYEAFFAPTLEPKGLTAPERFLLCIVQCPSCGTEVRGVAKHVKSDPGKKQDDVTVLPMCICPNCGRTQVVQIDAFNPQPRG
jgi:hypothetical protein